jgi:hypothetical protein
MIKSKFLIAICFLLSIGFAASAADAAAENFKFELSGSAWILNPSGQIQANGAPIDLVKDLAAQQNQPTFFGQFVFKPGRRHRIVVEGSPLRLGGTNTLSRTIVYHDEIYHVNETVTWNSSLNYAFGGYQYDVLSNPAGHLGFSIGGAYLGGTAEIHTVPNGISSSKSQSIGLPLAGAEFRVFPIPHHSLFEINGSARGIAVGSYGHYIEGTGSAGLLLGHVALEGGYRAVNANLHDTKEGGSGLFLHLNGPIVSLVVRY